jgi:hypothetical protein
MDKNLLVNVLNSNQSLMQSISKSKYMREETMGVLRNIESEIPEDCRQNFYTNLRTLTIAYNAKLLETHKAAGMYSPKYNALLVDEHIASTGEITDDFAQTLSHEFRHMASTTRYGNHAVSGFQNVVKDDKGKVVYTEELKGLTEGFTEHLSMQASGKDSSESPSEYGEQIDASSK